MDIESLRNLCLSFSAVTEDIKWDNDLCFSVGGKMFCVASLDGSLRVSFKVPDDAFAELASREGFMPAPYMARAKWVSVTGVSTVNPREWHFFIRQSYELVKRKLPKGLRSQLGLSD